MADFTLGDASRFPEGTRVGAYPRITDRFSGATDAEKTVTVGSGPVTFKGLRDDAPYWAAGEVDGQTVAVAFTATSDQFRGLAPDLRRSREATNLQTEQERQARNKQREAIPDLKVAETFATAHGPLAATDPLRTTIVGARNTLSARQERYTGDDRKFEKGETEGQPFLNQEDVPKSVPQRSATALGQATPKPEDEPQPKPSQDTVDRRTPQRSSTPLGEATPKDPKEEQPYARQEDVPKGMLQRSATPHGSAQPKPVGASPAKLREHESDRDSSLSKAVGSTEQQTDLSTRPTRSKAKGPRDRIKVEEDTKGDKKP